ncbi:2-C-methyl-D-erythritol 4-phosphate cytidylyltransferase [Sphingobacterium sp. N143]|uniref:2-C-methyl-D-erythritol 4-phosphate cytidylyltransferase n=1 Tax=Sphingobacterium sp. N143 TaxID=2746727 RepID=UPI002578A3C0|nr:2-C-methyl-D-erythritol 4-phosphate cytidylyltransferase [Sphingobacterium sp. N143]MDM1292895.1 2-C-methyl-D-erythritol 4-phosphate cytidylyltransferase [Sphingobacterium sp. N143]
MNFVIIVAAGTGNRMNSDLPKQFIELNGKPVIMHTIDRFFQSDEMTEIVVVISQEMEVFWKDLCLKHQFSIPVHLAFGGNTRFSSVKNGIQYIQQNFNIGPADYIAVHDGARPIISKDLISRAFQGAYEHQAIVLAQKSIESVRKGTPTSNQAIDRDQIWMIQTPQVFQAALLLDAYQQTEDPLFTDDASVVEKMGKHISMVEGDSKNIKITYPQDLQIAQFYLSLI